MTDKETIGCNVSCTPFGNYKDVGTLKGPYTHCRTEGISVLNFALNMARHGHKTTICGYEWGDRREYPLPENVILKNDVGGTYDIWVDAGWENTYAPVRCSKVKADIYCHTWGGPPRPSGLAEYLNDKKNNGLNMKNQNHFMARVSRAFWKEYEEYPYSIYIPTPLVDKIKTIGNFGSKKMLWANRGSFNKDYADRSEKVLSFMEKLSGRDEGYYYTVLLWGDIKEKALGIGRIDIIERFEKLKTRNEKTRLLDPYSGIGHDEFLRELNESVILLDTAHPSEHLANLEAVCMGTVPLIWRGAGEHHFQIFGEVGHKADDYHQLGNKVSYNVNDHGWDFDGPNGIDKILNDEKLYNEYFKDLASTVVDHEWDNSYKIFIDDVKRVGEDL